MLLKKESLARKDSSQKPQDAVPDRA
ncbi:MAG: hypothetical protein ACJASL_002636 [Paraglaciecola sp.]